MSQPRKLTPTSYVILGHLALRTWSTYELAQQMKRSTRHYWPRAESKIYEEPKKLVAHGLATATREYTGRRPRTVYAITDQGRESLRRWLDQPGQPPLATLRSIREHAEQTRAQHIALAADLAQTGGPFPDRLHVNELVFKFMWEQTETVIRWATWSEEQVARWPDDIARADGLKAGATLHRAAAAQSPGG